MPNFVAALKEEIKRLARREARAESLKLRKFAAQARRDLAALKRQAASQLRALKALQSSQSKGSSKPPADLEATSKARFSPRWLLAMRKRLDLSAAQLGKLLGVSALSVYKWEKGQATPRARYMPQIVAVRQMGKREAQAALAAVKSSNK